MVFETPSPLLGYEKYFFEFFAYSHLTKPDSGSVHYGDWPAMYCMNSSSFQSSQEQPNSNKNQFCISKNGIELTAVDYIAICACF
jgi:hypothetical protein